MNQYERGKHEPDWLTVQRIAQVLGVSVAYLYAEDDAFYPVDAARGQEAQIRDESGAEVQFFYYPAGHAFHNEGDALGTYNEACAKQAWSRAVDFLKANVK